MLEKLPRLQELGPEGVVCATGAGPGEVSHAALADVGENIWKKCPCSAARGAKKSEQGRKPCSSYSVSPVASTDKGNSMPSAKGNI